MTNLEILSGFEREINMIDDTVNKPVTEDSLFWLNQGIAKFVKTRFNGDFAHKQGYEQTEKRRQDLINLFKSTNLDVYLANKQPSYDVYNVNYPDDFMYALNEDVVISDTKGNNKMNTCVFECTQDSFMYRVNNSLTDFHYRYGKARPLRIRTTEGCKLLTDKNYQINNYTLGYLRTPNEIKLEGPVYEYTDFETNVMYEIIKIAAQMFIENQKNDRYQTISNEVLTQE